jgi:hypothetical protein
MEEEAFEVTRWRRYGKDRVYVARADGTSVGWWDLQADEAHPEGDAELEALTTAVRPWRAGAEPPVAVVELAAVPSASATTASVKEQVAEAPMVQDRPWLDLTTNSPGAEARAQAVAAKEAAPVRTVLARALGVHTDERAWRLGANGEEKVAAQFDKVRKKDPRWQFIHAIPVGSRGSDIDHLIIGPGGVFTANTKNHPNAKIWVGGDTFLVNGSRQPYVRNARHEAARAAKLLSAACGYPVHVEGLIVPVDPIEVDVKTPPRDVHVVTRREIAGWLLRHGDVLDQSQQTAVFDAARRSTTWQ